MKQMAEKPWKTPEPVHTIHNVILNIYNLLNKIHKML